MERIRWIITPDCRICNPVDAMRRRYACIGCDKRAVGPRLPEPGISRSSRLRLKARDREIFSLRADGRSFGEIARKFGIPRSTAYNAVRRAAGR